MGVGVGVGVGVGSSAVTDAIPKSHKKNTFGRSYQVLFTVKEYEELNPIVPHL